MASERLSEDTSKNQWKNDRKIMDFWDVEIMKIVLLLKRGIDFLFFEIFEQKSKNWSKKRRKFMFLTQKSTPGRSKGSLFRHFNRFLRVRKNVDFSMSLREAKKSIKIEPWALQGRLPRSGSSSVWPFRRPRVPGRRPIIKEIDESMIKTAKVRGLTRRWAWRPGEF